MDAFVNDATTEVRPSITGSACVAKKLRTVSKKMGDKLRCHQRAVATAVTGSGEVDASCLTRAEDHFDAGFAFAETRPDCQTTGDAAALEAKVDAVVDDVVSELRVRCP